MIGVDTNVLLRYVLKDDSYQSALAKHLIDDVCSPQQPAQVCTIALAEMVWVLRARIGIDRPGIASALRNILDNPHIRFDNHLSVVIALDAFDEGKADFPDYLIYEINRSVGAAITYTFDKLAARSGFLSLLDDSILMPGSER